MEDDNYLRSDEQLRAKLGSMFYAEDTELQYESRAFLERLEAIDPGHTEWFRGEVLKILQDDSRSIEERLAEYTDNDFEGGPQTAWDFWAYIWETVTDGEPWPADLPRVNMEAFAYLRKRYEVPSE